jgi:ribonuclease VapC
LTDYVLDSFALTAYLQREEGGPIVADLFSRAQTGESRLFMSTINLGETLYVIYRRGGPGAFANVLNLVADLPIRFVDADLALSVIAARIKAVLPISFGDCFAASLAIERRATVLTGDLDFERMAHLVAVEWLPKARS